MKSGSQGPLQDQSNGNIRAASKTSQHQPMGNHRSQLSNYQADEQRKRQMVRDNFLMPNGSDGLVGGLQTSLEASSSMANYQKKANYLNNSVSVNANPSAGAI